jgi:hypothetical protein
VRSLHREDNPVAITEGDHIGSSITVDVVSRKKYYLGIDMRSRDKSKWKIVTWKITLIPNGRPGWTNDQPGSLPNSGNNRGVSFMNRLAVVAASLLAFSPRWKRAAWQRDAPRSAGMQAEIESTAAR